MRSLDKVPDVEEAAVDIGRSPAFVRLDGRNEVGETGSDVFTVLLAGDLGVGRHDGCTMRRADII